MCQGLILSREAPALVADTDSLHITVTAPQRGAGRSDGAAQGWQGGLRRSGCGDPRGHPTGAVAAEAWPPTGFAEEGARQFPELRKIHVQ